MAEQIPGIIVRTVDDTGVVAPPTFERYPVSIGMGDPYRIITDKLLTRGTGTIDDIGSITSVNEIVSVGDLPGIAKYIDGVDYQLSGGNIQWLGVDSPTAGDNYYTTFTETRPASAYTPMLYFDENQVYEDHGSAIRTNGALNDASKGAGLMFDNGAKGVMVLQLNPTPFVDTDNPTNAELETAFLAAVDQLELITDYKLYLVPMSSGTLNTTTAGQIMFNHAVLASQPENKQERSVVMAMPKNTTYQQYAAQAQAFAHERMFLPAIPSELQVFGVNGTYDDRYYCAATAGAMCSPGIGINISDEIIAGVTFTDNFRPGEQNYLVQNGVSPAKSRAGVVRNIMFITTDTTSALTEDAGVQDVKDYVKKYWREGLWSVYKNKPITNLLPSQVRGTSVTMLDKLIEDSIIAEHRRITVVQDVVEPRKLRVTGQIKPAFGVQWMDITFTFVTSFSS